jgi:hypothetical protein
MADGVDICPKIQSVTFSNGTEAGLLNISSSFLVGPDLGLFQHLSPVSVVQQQIHLNHFYDLCSTLFLVISTKFVGTEFVKFLNWLNDFQMNLEGSLRNCSIPIDTQGLL